jgi:hypothetical protein
VKWLYGIGAVLLATYMLLFQPSWHRYRLTLAVETPEGPRQASGVLQSLFSYNYGANGTLTVCALRGEAVFLDLPGGRNLVMLLTHGPMGDRVDAMCTLPAWALLGPGGHSKLFDQGWLLRRLSGSTTLPPELIPTLVTFTDLNNPASAQVVYATGTEERWVHGRGLVNVGKVFEDRFTALYGPGYALKEVRLEMVSAGIWPFNLLPIPFPQVLFGTPITTGIKGRFTWWDKPEVTQNPGWMRLPDISRRALGSMKRGN